LAKSSTRGQPCTTPLDTVQTVIEIAKLTELRDELAPFGAGIQAECIHALARVFPPVDAGCRELEVPCL
jgi:hypothetical protein